MERHQRRAPQSRENATELQAESRRTNAWWKKKQTIISCISIYSRWMFSSSFLSESKSFCSALSVHLIDGVFEPNDLCFSCLVFNKNLQFTIISSWCFYLIHESLHIMFTICIVLLHLSGYFIFHLIFRFKLMSNLCIDI